ncbi:MAG: PqiC family protein [Geminicoccaceae bacterium]
MIRRLVPAVVVLAGLAACSGTPESHYYLLGGTTGAAGPAAEAEARPLLFVDPVTVAPYADRSQMATRLGGEVRFAEFEVWAQPVGSLVTAALVDRLGERFGLDRVMATPQRADFEAPWRLGVDVLRLDAEGGEAVLDARWTLLGPRGELQATRRLRLAEPLADPASFPQRVAAFDRAVDRLADSVGQALAAAGAR